MSAVDWSLILLFDLPKIAKNWYFRPQLSAIRWKRVKKFTGIFLSLANSYFPFFGRANEKHVWSARRLTMKWIKVDVVRSCVDLLPTKLNIEHRLILLCTLFNWSTNAQTTFTPLSKKINGLRKRSCSMTSFLACICSIHCYADWLKYRSYDFFPVSRTNELCICVGV